MTVAAKPAGDLRFLVDAVPRKMLRDGQVVLAEIVQEAVHAFQDKRGVKPERDVIFREKLVGMAPYESRSTRWILVRARHPNDPRAL